MKINKIKSGVFSLFFISLFFTFPLKGQVTVGGTNPNPSAVMDVRSNDHYGLLLPNLALSSSTDSIVLAGGVHVQGMLVYNTATAGDVRPGVYYNDGKKWVKVGERWFYMPSFNLSLTATGPNHFDLYGEYKRQFTKSGNLEFITSNSSASVTDVQPVYTSDQLDYYVISYPISCMTITGIDTAGVMYYNLNSTNIPEGSSMTVIFVVK